MSFEGVRDETKLELFTAVYDLPSTTLESESGQDIFSQGIFRESSDVSDRAATEDDSRAGHPCAVHAIALDFVEFPVHVETLVKRIVSRYVIESLMGMIRQSSAWKVRTSGLISPVGQQPLQPDRRQ